MSGRVAAKAREGVEPAVRPQRGWVVERTGDGAPRGLPSPVPEVERARLRPRAIAEPGCIGPSAIAHDRLRTLDRGFEDPGEPSLGSVDRLAGRLRAVEGAVGEPGPVPRPARPDRPSIAALPSLDGSAEPGLGLVAAGFIEHATTARSRTGSRLRAGSGPRRSAGSCRGGSRPGTAGRPVSHRRASTPGSAGAARSRPPPSGRPRGPCRARAARTGDRPRPGLRVGARHAGLDPPLPGVPARGADARRARRGVGRPRPAGRSGGAWARLARGAVGPATRDNGGAAAGLGRAIALGLGSTYGDVPRASPKPSPVDPARRRPRATVPRHSARAARSSPTSGPRASVHLPEGDLEDGPQRAVEAHRGRPGQVRPLAAGGRLRRAAVWATGGGRGG